MLNVNDEVSYEARESLRINYVRRKDAGEYVCRAQNSRGVDEKSVVIILVVDGGYTEWSDYSECSVDCGKGCQFIPLSYLVS